MNTVFGGSDHLTPHDLRILELLANGTPPAAAARAARNPELTVPNWQRRLADAATQRREEPLLVLLACVVLAVFALVTSLT